MALEMSIYVPKQKPKLDYWSTTRAVTIGTRTVYVFITESPDAVAKWVRHVRRSYPKQARDLVVGVFTARDDDHRYVSLLTLCVGSNCLVYQNYFKNPEKHSWPDTHPVHKELREFCADPGIRFVGEGLLPVAKIIADHCGLKFSKAMELLPLAKKLVKSSAMKWEDLLDAVTRALWGGYVNVNKPVGKNRLWHLTDDQLLYIVLEAYLASEVGQTVLP